jgi:hypothetical protein
MGHTNVVTTLGIYTHLFEPDNDDVVRKLQADRTAARGRPNTGNVVPIRA